MKYRIVKREYPSGTERYVPQNYVDFSGTEFEYKSGWRDMVEGYVPFSLIGYPLDGARNMIKQDILYRDLRAKEAQLAAELAAGIVIETLIEEIDSTENG